MAVALVGVFNKILNRKERYVNQTRNSMMPQYASVGSNSFLDALDYQTVYYRKKTIHVPLAVHIAAAVLLFCALAAKVWIQLQCTSEGYTLAKIRQQTIAMDMERRELELHKSVLLKPDNLIMRSKKKLGLEPLRTSQAKKIYY